MWKTPLLPAIEFFKAQYTNFAYAPHFHEDYAIGVVEHGIHAFYYRGEHHAITPGHVVTCQPGEIHTGQPGNDETWCFRMLYLNPDLVATVAAELGYRSSALPFLSYTAIAQQPLVEMVRMLHQQSEASDSTLSQEILAREMLERVLCHYSEIRPQLAPIHNEKAPVTRVKQHIQEHYAQDLQLEDLAAVAHFSKSYFIRAFRHHEGISPYAYLIQVRLNRARQLLQQGYPAGKVAQETGFFDQSHLTRYFKRFMGMTPGRYQQAIG